MDMAEIKRRKNETGNERTDKMKAEMEKVGRFCLGEEQKEQFYYSVTMVNDNGQ